jgi:redoxin
MVRFVASLSVGLWLLTGGTASAQVPAPAPAPSPAVAPAVGDVVHDFDTVAAVDGASRHVGFPKGSSTVLLFFLSGCPTCHKMIPEWNRAYERRPAGLQVVGVLMDQEPPGFFATTPIAFPVVRTPSREWLSTIPVRRAPVTLRIAPGGKVEDVAVGLVDPIRLGEIFRK